MMRPGAENEKTRLAALRTDGISHIRRLQRSNWRNPRRRKTAQGENDRQIQRASGLRFDADA